MAGRRLVEARIVVAALFPAGAQAGTPAACSMGAEVLAAVAAAHRLEADTHCSCLELAEDGGQPWSMIAI